jgi:hypothetical protein
MSPSADKEVKFGMMKEGLVVAVILLCIGPSIASSINANMPITNEVTSATRASTITTYQGTLSGYVTDSVMNPIEGARIRVYFHDSFRENYSDATGYFHVTDIPICNCTKNATCSKEGYHPTWVYLTIWDNTTYDFVLTPLECYPVFNGTMRNEGYVSPVTVTFLYNPDTVAEINYEYDEGWKQYTEPFTIYKQGEIIFKWNWVDYIGNTYNPDSIILKIDYTPPIINLTIIKIGVIQWEFIATAYDTVSGLSNVEFYLDNQLLGNVTASPYEWIWTGIGRHTVKAIAYDVAGNNASTSAIMSYTKSQSCGDSYFSILLKWGMVHIFDILLFFFKADINE